MLQEIKRQQVVFQLRHTLFCLYYEQPGAIRPALKDVLIVEVGTFEDCQLLHQNTLNPFLMKLADTLMQRHALVLTPASGTCLVAPSVSLCGCLGDSPRRAAAG